MNRVLSLLVKRALSMSPSAFLGNTVSLTSAIVPYLPERDIPFAFENPYYGSVKWLLNPKYRIERELMYTRCFDRKSLLYFMRLIKTGDTCLDIGANMGALTLSMCHRVGDGGRVIAFEPGPELFHRLCANVARSKRNNVCCVKAGLSNRIATMQWKMEGGENCGNASMVENDGDQIVEVTTLDESPDVRNLSRVDFVKIDVEGMELEVLQGGVQMIQRCQPHILLETNDCTIESPETRDICRSLELLRELGYSFWEINIPERELTDFRPEFRFIKTNYPKLPQNTLAVHGSKEGVLA